MKYLKYFYESKSDKPKVKKHDIDGFIVFQGKDANEIGFEAFLNTLEHTEPLTFQSLLEKKLQNI